MSSETTAVAVQYRLKEWAQQVVSVNPCLLRQGLSASVNGFSIHVTESTPMPLLAAVLEVVRNCLMTPTVLKLPESYSLFSYGF